MKIARFIIAFGLLFAGCSKPTTFQKSFSFGKMGWTGAEACSFMAPIVDSSAKFTLYLDVRMERRSTLPSANIMIEYISDSVGVYDTDSLTIIFGEENKHAFSQLWCDYRFKIGCGIVPPSGEFWNIKVKKCKSSIELNEVKAIGILLKEEKRGE